MNLSRLVDYEVRSSMINSREEVKRFFVFDCDSLWYRPRVFFLTNDLVGADVQRCNAPIEEHFTMTVRLKVVAKNTPIK